MKSIPTAARSAFRHLRIRKWRKHWRDDVFLRRYLTQRGHTVFTFDREYRLIKLFVMADQKRGAL